MVDWVSMILVFVVGGVLVPVFLSKNTTIEFGLLQFNLLVGCACLILWCIAYIAGTSLPGVLAMSLFNIMVWMHAKYWKKRAEEKNSLKSHMEKHDK